jgi:hypothetical protein
LGCPGGSFNIPVARPGRARTTVGMPGTGLSWRVEAPAGPAAELPNSRRLRPGQLDVLKQSLLGMLIETPQARADYTNRARSQDDAKRRTHHCINAAVMRLAAGRGLIST